MAQNDITPEEARAELERRRNSASLEAVDAGITPEEARAEIEARRERAKRMQGSVLDNPESRSRGLLGGVVDSLSQGLTFGLGDEIEAGIRAPFSKDQPFEGATAKDRFDAILFDLEQKRDAFRKTNPATSGLAEIGGGVLQGAGLLKGAQALAPSLTSKVTSLPFLPRLGAIGAAEGAAFGAGSASPGERLAGAGQGAAFGGLGAPVFGSAAAIAGKTIRPVVQKLIDSFSETPKSKAIGLVTNALQRDDITPEEASAILRRFGRPAALADIGENLGDLTRTAATIPSRGKQSARIFLDERQEGQRIRLVQAARNASGKNAFDEEVINVINNAESKAQPLYQEAYSQVLDVTPQMAEILKRPAMQTAMVKAGRKVKNMGFSDDIVNNVTDVRYMDTVKRALDDDIGIAQRQGRRDDVRILSQLKNDFLSEIDSQVPAYAEARNVFSGEASIRDAVDLGRNALSNKFSTDDLNNAIKNMTDSEIQGMRHGLLTGITDQLDSLQNVTGAANRLSKIPKLKNALRAVFPDSNALEDFLQQAVSEGRFAQTRNTVIGGSPTSRIQASQRAASSESSPLNIMLDSMTGGGASIVNGLKRAVFKTDIEPEVADELIKILLDPNVIPKKLRQPFAQRSGDFIIPRMGRASFPGAVGGGTGSLLIDQENKEPKSILDMLIQTPNNKLFAQ